MEKIDIMSLLPYELEDEMKVLGESRFRAGQVFSWLHAKHVLDFNEMSSINKELRAKLSEKFYIPKLGINKILESSKDDTVKYLFETKLCNIIESVYMNYDFGKSVCVSSQAGCRMGCKFCASTLNGLERNLTAAEMLLQIYCISLHKSQRISNIVVMGCGEPLDNYDALLRFIKLINNKNGLNIGQRHITVSTCGIIEKIDELAAEKLQINLAVSLHSPNDDIRRSIMPIANRYGITDLLNACRNYSKHTGRRVSYEYALISGINDSVENAFELAARLRGTLSHVNLIPVNEVEERGFKKVSKERAEQFLRILVDKGIQTTIRRELGSDIGAACGQLRNNANKNRQNV